MITECRFIYTGSEIVCEDKDVLCEFVPCISSCEYASACDLQKQIRSRCPKTCDACPGTVTVNGERCKIPFKYDGQEYNKCTTAGYRNGDSWCATSVENDLTYDDWDWC